VTTWRTERRFDDDAVDPWHDPRTDPWHDDPPPRRALTPRQRFGPPVPISPPVSPVVRPGPQPPALRRPPPQPPVKRPPPLAPVPPPRHIRHRTPRNRYDWRVTKHAARDIEIVDDEKHYLATFGWTMAWFAVPYALFAAWTLTFPANPGTACARPTGNACPAPRSLALTTLLDSLPRVGIALALALLIAGLIRLGSAAWRPATAAFSAAIIGAGAATVLYSVLNSTG